MGLRFTCVAGWGGSRKYAVPLLDAHTPRKIRVGFKDSGIHRLATWWTDLWRSRSLAQKTRLGTLVVMLWRRWCRVVVVTEGASQQDRGLGRMSQRTAAWVAWSVCAVCLLLVGFALVLIVLGWSTPLPKGWTSWPDQAVSLVGVLGAPVLGGLIASRRRENPYGWLWLALGLSLTLIEVSESYAAYSLLVEPGVLPAPRVANGMLEGLAWVVAIALLPFLLLLFPTGRLPSRRWRPLAWIVLVAGAMGVTLGPFVGGESLLIVAVVMVIVAASILSALSCCPLQGGRRGRTPAAQVVCISRHPARGRAHRRHARPRQSSRHLVVGLARQCQSHGPLRSGRHRYTALTALRHRHNHKPYPRLRSSHRDVGCSLSRQRGLNAVHLPCSYRAEISDRHRRFHVGHRRAFQPAP